MDKLISALREAHEYAMEWGENPFRYAALYKKAADAIEELLEAAKAMHTWIFLNSLDEQAAYDECGLTNEMNTALGYGGQFVAELPKDE